MRFAKLPVSILCLAAALAFAPQALAGMRCGQRLVQEGDSAAHLLLECGEPLLQQVIALDETSSSEGVVEQWSYDLGAGRFLRIVTLEGGRVARIEEGERSRGE